MPIDVTDLPIGEAAHEVLDLERSVPLDGQFDITLGDSSPIPACVRTLRARSGPARSGSIAWTM
jgi:hypothetical protein